MALKKFIYPLDLRGDRDSNRVEENHTIGTQEYRAFALKNGPFYTKDLAVRERNTNKLLKRGLDYECVFFYDDLSALTPGKEICGVIVVHNTAVSTDIKVSANIVGGPFAQSAQAIQNAIDALEINNKNTYWQNIIDKPDLFQPTPHMHDFGDIFGFEFLIDVLGHIRDTLLVGGNAQFEQVRSRIDALENTLRALHQEHIDDFNNPHKTTAEQVNAYDKERIDQFIQVLNVALADLEPRFRSLVNGVSDINDRIDGLVQALNNNNIQLNQNAQSLSRVHTIIAELNSSVDDVNDEFSKVRTEMQALRDRDDELEQAINKNTSDISREKGRIDQHATTLGQLAAKDNEHDNKIAQLESDGRDYEKQLAALAQKDTQLQTGINEAKSAANNAQQTANSKIPDAPKDGKVYGRKNGAWVVSTDNEVIQDLTDRVEALEEEVNKVVRTADGINTLETVTIESFFTNDEIANKDCTLIVKACTIGGGDRTYGSLHSKVSNWNKITVLIKEGSKVIGRGGNGEARGTCPGENQTRTDGGHAVTFPSGTNAYVEIDPDCTVIGGGAGGKSGWCVSCGYSNSGTGGAGGGGAGLPGGKGGRKGYQISGTCSCSSSNYGKDGTETTGGRGGAKTGYDGGDVSSQAGSHGGDLGQKASRPDGRYPISAHGAAGAAVVGAVKVTRH